MSTYQLNHAHLEDKLVHIMMPTHIPYVILHPPILIVNRSHYIVYGV
jgi:hypothetical protein